jgi:hypothetical protein
MTSRDREFEKEAHDFARRYSNTHGVDDFRQFILGTYNADILPDDYFDQVPRLIPIYTKPSANPLYRRFYSASLVQCLIKEYMNVVKCDRKMLDDKLKSVYDSVDVIYMSAYGYVTYVNKTSEQKALEYQAEQECMKHVEEEAFNREVEYEIDRRWKKEEFERHVEEGLRKRREALNKDE